jgi:hypothetical protein
LRGAPARHPARILAKGVVPHPVQAVLDSPVVARQIQQRRRVGPFRREAGDRVRGFEGFDAVDDAGSLNSANLFRARPVEIIAKPLGSQKSPVFDAVGVFVEIVGFADFSLPRALFRGGKRERRRPARCPV